MRTQPSNDHYWVFLNSKHLQEKSGLVSKLFFKKSLTLEIQPSSNLPLKQLQISSWVTYENVIYVKEHFS